MKPEEELMSSAAEADKSSAAEAAVGLEDEAVMTAISLLLSMLTTTQYSPWSIVRR